VTSIYLLAVTTRTGSKKSTRALLFLPEMQEQIPGQSAMNEQVSQIRQLSRSIERGTNEELKGLVATLVLGPLEKNRIPS
jgi:hypothetical protein